MCMCLHALYKTRLLLGLVGDEGPPKLSSTLTMLDAYPNTTRSYIICSGCDSQRLLRAQNMGVMDYGISMQPTCD